MNLFNYISYKIMLALVLSEMLKMNRRASDWIGDGVFVYLLKESKAAFKNSVRSSRLNPLGQYKVYVHNNQIIIISCLYLESFVLTLCTSED